MTPLRRGTLVVGWYNLLELSVATGALDGGSPCHMSNLRIAVFEIKGALGARCAHFRGRDMCARCAHVFSHNYHSYMSEECIEKFPGAQFQNEWLISNTELVLSPVI